MEDCIPDKKAALSLQRVIPQIIRMNFEQPSVCEGFFPSVHLCSCFFKVLWFFAENAPYKILLPMSTLLFIAWLQIDLNNIFYFLQTATMHKEVTHGFCTSWCVHNQLLPVHVSFPIKPLVSASTR